MIHRNEPLESLCVRSVAKFIALSIGITTTINPSNIIYIPNVNSYIADYLRDYTSTTTPSPKQFKVKQMTNYAVARELFGTSLQDFTIEETDSYNKFLDKIYKSTGVNIFDIC